MNVLFARHALLPEGWRRDVLLEWDAQGDLTRVQPDAAQPTVPDMAAVPVAEHVLPGMINLHSHAFQQVLAGLAERAGDPGASGAAGTAPPDSFWTWRDLMYRVAGIITPEQIEAVAAQLYADCLRHGYTSVCEFHYLHGAPGGPVENAQRIVQAARTAGIGLTLLPVMYAHAGFGAAPLSPRQARFAAGPETVLDIVEALEPERGPQLEVGAAPHSLRAVDAAGLRTLLEALPAGRPLHIHVAEQPLEVRQCQDATGLRPVEYLMLLAEVDARWCLVHATHVSPDELARLAASGAVVGLCPTTEANLGDGVFPLEAYVAAGGRFGIGSDSHVSHSPAEELRWLEYGQRLLHGRRNIACGGPDRDVAGFLWQRALAGGAQAAGRRLGALEQGRRADLLVLDSAHPALAGLDERAVLGRFLFGASDNLVRDVLAGGQWVVRDGHHVAQDAVARCYIAAVRELRAHGG